MILVAYGTRPEIIKLFPLVSEFERQSIPFKTLFTGQHLDLFEDVKGLMPAPDYSCGGCCLPDQPLAESFSSICSSVEKIISENKFELIVIQGDTTTACAIAMAGFYNRVKVAHVEAGLRTNDISVPFPEEANRSIISRLADVNFAPTEIARQNLADEGARNIFLTGNTIVDALRHFKVERSFSNIGVVTIHRRENHGRMRDIFKELCRASREYPDIDFVFPIHPNPNVQKHRDILQGRNLRVIDPLRYGDMLKLIGKARFIISDSGGLQEEAVYFGKKILILRENTERPETVEVGLGKLVGIDFVDHIEWALDKGKVPTKNPFGDGKSCRRICEVIKREILNA